MGTQPGNLALIVWLNYAVRGCTCDWSRDCVAHFCMVGRHRTVVAHVCLLGVNMWLSGLYPTDRFDAEDAQCDVRQPTTGSKTLLTAETWIVRLFLPVLQLSSMFFILKPGVAFHEAILVQPAVAGTDCRHGPCQDGAAWHKRIIARRHAVDKKLVGPSHEEAAKYKKRQTAEVKLTATDGRWASRRRGVPS